MKFVLHARSLIDSLGGCYDALLERIIDVESDWSYWIPDGFTEAESKQATAKLKSGGASQSWRRSEPSDIGEEAIVISLGSLDEDDPALQLGQENPRLIVGYDPRCDPYSTQLSALFQRKVSGILSPLPESELPPDAKEAEVQFYRERLIKLPPTLDCNDASKTPKRNEPLILIKAMTDQAPTILGSVPSNWPWDARFSQTLSHWSPALKSFNCRRFEDASTIDANAATQIAERERVIAISNDATFCQTVAAIATVVETECAVIADPAFSPHLLSETGASPELSIIEPIRAGKLRAFLRPINQAGIESQSGDAARCRQYLNRAQPSVQLQLIKEALAEGTTTNANGAATNEDNLHSEPAASWTKLWSALRDKGVSIPGLTRRSPVHALQARAPSAASLEFFAMRMLFAETADSKEWLNHFAACIRQYPDFLSKCEISIATHRRFRYPNLLASGDAWATALANRIVAANEDELFSEKDAIGLETAAATGLDLVRWDEDQNRVVEGSEFSLIYWATITGTQDELPERFQSERRTAFLCHTPIAICLLSLTRYKDRAIQLLDYLKESDSEPPKDDRALLLTALAFALGNNFSVANPLLQTLYQSNPRMLIQSRDALGFDPSLYFAILFQIAGKTTLAKQLFNIGAAEIANLVGRSNSCLGRIPQSSDLDVPNFLIPETL